MKYIISKRCTLCGENKSISDFHKDKRVKSGYRSNCKSCQNKRSSNYFNNNKKHVRELHKDYYGRNKDSKIKQAKDWYENNKDKHKESCKKYIKNHYEQSLASSRKRTKKWTASNPEYRNQWRAENPNKGRQYSQNRKARVVGNGGEITAKEWEDLLDFYGHKCLACNKTDEEIPIHLDHVKPISKGGVNVIENAQPLCKSCNSSKGTRTIDYR